MAAYLDLLSHDHNGAQVATVMGVKIPMCSSLVYRLASRYPKDHRR